MAGKIKPPKNTPAKRSKQPVAAFPKPKAMAASILTVKDLEDAYDALKRPASKPDTMLMAPEQMDALRYAMAGMSALKLKVGDWFMIGNNIYEINGVYQGSIDAKNIETGTNHKIDKYSRTIKLVPKGNPAMLRTLYGK